jgi:starch synthase
VRIVHVTAEAAPYAKTGGLGDVLGALPAAQVATHDVWVIHPWYATLACDPPPLWIGDVRVPFDGGVETVGIGTAERVVAGGVVRYAFVGHAVFARERLYGDPDDAKRFALFACALPAVAARLQLAPDVVHLHDWHAALAAAVLRLGDRGLAFTPSVLSIHNAQYQGWCDADAPAAWAGLPAAWTPHLAAHGGGNLLHAGLIAADRVSTVSPSYAAELRSAPGGAGLEATFAALGPRLNGILNGIDVDAYDPAHDPAIAAAIRADDDAGKRACGAALRREFGLEERPTLGIVSRLADQKGIDLVFDAWPALRLQGWNLALLGSGDAALEGRARAAFAANPGRLAGRIGFDEALARRIYAGSDALLVPSRFEPCGLAQLIAMRYGTLPIARATGGLRDTIVDGRSGFLFDEVSGDALAAAAARAIAALRDPAASAALRRNAMAERFDWRRATLAYDALYREVARPGGTR